MNWYLKVTLIPWALFINFSCNINLTHPFLPGGDINNIKQFLNRDLLATFITIILYSVNRQ